jgi:hypothetical protein
LHIATESVDSPALVRDAPSPGDAHGSTPAESSRSTCEIAAESTALSGHLNAANYRLLKLIAEFDRRRGWSDGLTKSCAHWLNWQCGLNLGAAREKVRVAHALEQLPKISAAMERGQLSYAKVRAITRVADASTEDHFLELALSGTAHHVEKAVSQFRNVLEVAELARERWQQMRRALHFSWDDDGSLVIRGRLPAGVGALVMRAIDSIVESMSPGEAAESIRETRADDARISIDIAGPHVDVAGPPRDFAGPQVDVAGPSFDVAGPQVDVAKPSTVGESPTWSQRRADALVIVADSYLAHGAEALAAGDRHQVIVHVAAETLCTREAGRCEIENGPSIAAETARRLACDAGIVTIVEDDRGEPLDVGRKTRAIPPAMRRALAARDRGCRFPGCPSERFVDGHHLKHWADGGETKLANLVTLCRFHHREVHEGRLVVERLDDGAWRFSKSDGEALVVGAAAAYAAARKVESRTWHRDHAIHRNDRRDV